LYRGLLGSNERDELCLGGIRRFALLPKRGIVELEPAYSLMREFDWYEVSSFRCDDFQQRAWVMHVVTMQDSFSEAWEAPRIALVPPRPEQFCQIDDLLCGDLADRNEHFSHGAYDEDPFATPPNAAFETSDALLLDDATVAWARRLVTMDSELPVELCSPIEVHFASRLIESSPTNSYDRTTTSWTWRVGFAATFSSRRVLVVVEATLFELDFSSRPAHEDLAKALRGEGLDTVRVGVIFPAPAVNASIDAEAADVLWLADPAPEARSFDEAALAAVLQMLDEPAIARLARRHRLPDSTPVRDTLFSMYRLNPKEIVTALPQKDLIWALLCPFETSPGRFEWASKPDQVSRLALNEEAQRLWFGVNYSCGPNVIESTAQAVREMIAKRWRER
jgi:hypothetical protein